MRLLLPIIFSLLLAACSTLPTPGPAARSATADEAMAVLSRSAASHGRPWTRYQKVEVSYEGEWSTIATRIQPVVTDPQFRKSSVEVYQPRQLLVRQVHSGPGGTKEVVRHGRRIEVKRNGERSSDPEVRDAAALVADAYTVFLFGTSWLAENARDVRLLESRALDGEQCKLVAGRLAPGVGNSPEDHFIAWIGEKSGLLLRYQFSLNGMDSTRGADVDVVFSGHWKAADGSVWPKQFVEDIQRPIRARAHVWQMVSLSLDGVRALR